jgi:hypothetical protein
VGEFADAGDGVAIGNGEPGCAGRHAIKPKASRTKSPAAARFDELLPPRTT